MYFHVYLKNGTVYVPTVAKMADGFYRDIEPVAVVAASNAEALRQALSGAITRGNPSAPALPRRQWPPPVVLKYAGAKNWSSFERDMSLWGLEEKGGAFTIIGKKKKDDGTVVDDPEQTVKFTSRTALDHVIDRMTALLQAAARKTE
jgi:hypothetical protein